MWYAWIALSLLSSVAPPAAAETAAAAATHAEDPPPEAIAAGGVPPAQDSSARPDDEPFGTSDLEASPPDFEASSPNTPARLEGKPAETSDSEPSKHAVEANPRDSEASPRSSDARTRELKPRPRSPQRTLNRNASELAWRNWLQSPESRDPGAPPRRITPKSVFVAPYNCPDGKRIQGEGCAKKAQISPQEHERHALEVLNKMQLSAPAEQELYDYDDVAPAPDAAGPLQLNLLPPSGPAPQSLPFRLPAVVDKKGDPQKVDLEAELERLKWQLERINPPLPSNPQLFNDYHALAQEKPKRENSNNTFPITNQDQGQKEVIFGNVAEESAQYLAINRSDITEINNLLKPSGQTSSTTETLTNDASQIVTKSDAPIKQTTPSTTATVTAEVMRTRPSSSGPNLKENEKPTRLHPEIDYSDLSEAVKIISRYAEVSTDDMFKSGQKKSAAEEGTLGTRTRLQHRRRPPAFPAVSAYEDRIPSHLVYPAPNYYRYPAPPPPPDYPFRHVQEYWARPEQYLGPYAHPNPRRHRHSYYPQPARRTRHPEPAAGVGAGAAPARDLYALLGLRHWFSGDGSAER